jgi:hypothetical protein
VIRLVIFISHDESCLLPPNRKSGLITSEELEGLQVALEVKLLLSEVETAEGVGERQEISRR